MDKRKKKCSHPSTIQVMKNSLYAIDISLSKSIAICSQQGWLRPLMVLLEMSGHGIPWIAGSAIALFQVENVKLMEVVTNLLLALVIDLCQIALLKGIFRRPRPSYNKNDMFVTVSLDNYSFPSGHATRAATVTLLMLQHLRFSFILRMFLLIWCLCVGLSRVMLGRHHVSDVGAGFVIGYLQFLLIEKVWISVHDWNDLKSLLFLAH